MPQNNYISNVVSCIGSIAKSEEMLSFPYAKSLWVKFYECEKCRNYMFYRIINAFAVHDVSICENPGVALMDFIQKYSIFRNSFSYSLKY